jgi:hypothetical protein
MLDFFKHPAIEEPLRSSNFAFAGFERVSTSFETLGASQRERLHTSSAGVRNSHCTDGILARHTYLDRALSRGDIVRCSLEWGWSRCLGRTSLTAISPHHILVHIGYRAAVPQIRLPAPPRHISSSGHKVLIRCWTTPRRNDRKIKVPISSQAGLPKREQVLLAVCCCKPNRKSTRGVQTCSRSSLLQMV